MSIAEQHRKPPVERIEPLTDQVRECRERAAKAKAKADATNNSALKAELLDMEMGWLILARSYGFIESLGYFTTANSERPRMFEERLQQSSVLVNEVRKNLDGPDDVLHEISTLLIQEGNLDVLYNRILDAAISLMSSDMASMQLLDPERKPAPVTRVEGISS
jgi:hypothetical protein